MAHGPADRARWKAEVSQTAPWRPAQMSNLRAIGCELVYRLRQCPTHRLNHPIGGPLVDAFSSGRGLV
jgi:hypothetical protein